jgi:hypothetical protein
LTPTAAGESEEQLSQMEHAFAVEAAKRNKQDKNRGKNFQQKSKTQRGNRNVRTSTGDQKPDEKDSGRRRRGNQDKNLKPPKPPKKPPVTPTTPPEPPKKKDGDA